MDILLVKLTFIVLAFTAVFVYSATIIHRIGFITYIKTIGHIFIVITKALGVFVTTIIGLLAAGTKTTDSNEATNNAVCGGVLNYRTGKFDDGTDPCGWYEKD